MAVLAAYQLCAQYGPQAVLREVTISVAVGELVGIVGPNGSGKTTLLRTLSGVQPVTAGEVQLDGRPLAAWPRTELARRMAVLRQDALPGLDITVWEAVHLGRYPYLGRWRSPGAADHQVVRRAMAVTGIAHLAARPLAALSGGENQRVAMARALAQEPAVLLLDEPSSHLDIHHQADLFDLLKQLTATGLAAVAVLHNLNLAAVYCQRLVLLNQGRVVAEGPPEAVLQPDNLESAYGRSVLISRHPLLDVPQVTVLPGA